VRSAEEIAERLGLPLLARLPEPPREVRTGNRLVMRLNPDGSHAEAFRMLRTNLRFVNLERGARTILITSALRGEGKTTTAANLAVALARAGRSVALIDLDLRRPAVAALFGLEGQGGFTDVALGQTYLEDALRPVPLSETGQANGAPARNGSAEPGYLEVLPSGPLPPDPGEFVNTSTVAEIIEAVRERVEIVIIDSPPVLTVGDAMVLSSVVDGIVAVARLSLIRRPAVGELRRVLDNCPSSKLGVVVTAAELEEGYGGYGYGYGYGYGTRRRDGKPERVATTVAAPRAGESDPGAGRWG
jgi:non-specific protein-tyrosine kinase